MRENFNYRQDRYDSPRQANLGRGNQEGWGDRWQHREQYDDLRQGSNGRGDWRNMRAADVMTHNVMTVFADDLATFAARKMGECDCGAIPVVDSQGRMIGMITDRDIAVRAVAIGRESPANRCCCVRLAER